MDDDWRERLVAASRVRVRTGDDPRWRRNGDLEEMGVMSGPRWATWLAEIGVPVRGVPPEFWSLDAEEDGTAVAVVACPCGHRPVVRAMAAHGACEEQCPRSFFFDGENVWAFNTPPSEPTPLPAL